MGGGGCGGRCVGERGVRKVCVGGRCVWGERGEEVGEGGGCGGEVGEGRCVWGEGVCGGGGG